MTTVTVMANSLTDLANKLVNSNWATPIAQVDRYDPPAYFADWSTTDQQNAPCTTMVNVTNQFNGVAASLGLFLNADINLNTDNSMTLDMTVEDWYTPAGTTSLWRGFSLAPTFGPYTPSGNLTLKGGASWGYQLPGQKPVFYYHAKGGLKFGRFSVATPVTNPALSLKFSGVGAYAAYTWYHGSLVRTEEISITGQNTTLVEAKSVMSPTDEANETSADPVVLDSHTLVGAYCCAAGVTPVLLYINQNLIQSRNLANFISRNNLTWSNNYSLIYRAASQSWQTNVSLKGLGTQQDTPQNWQANFDFGCANPSQLSTTGLAYLSVVSGGDGTHAYAVGDILTVGTGGGTVRVTTVNAGQVTTVSVNSPGTGYVVGTTYPTIASTGSGRGCTLVVTVCATAQTVTSVNNYWKFGMNIAMQDLRFKTNAHTRLILLFDTSLVCPDIRPISFNFTYNVLTQKVTPATIIQPVVSDGLGLFKSQVWESYPYLDITISATMVPDQQTISYPELTNPIKEVRGTAPLGDGTITTMT
jgi:hypothetical protein